MALSIMFCAGERSGDLNAAALACELKKAYSDIKMFGAGGNRMRKSGVDIRVDMNDFGTIGVITTLMTIVSAVKKFRQVRRLLLTEKPDIFIPVDFGFFNLRIAKLARKNGIKVIYYFPPSSWRKQLSDPGAIKPYVNHVITPFPWSHDILSKAGVDVYFEGHPLIDIVKPSVSRDVLFEELSLDRTKKLIGMLPGSRDHEIRYNLPIMLESTKLISQRTEAVYVICAGDNYEKFSKIVDRFTKSNPDIIIRVVKNCPYDVMAASDMLMTCSGTATLEAAILGIPMVIVYTGPFILLPEYFIRRKSIGSFIGLPNIIAEKCICKELLALDFTPKTLADEMCNVFCDEEKYNEMKNELKNVCNILGSNGVVKRCAELVAKLGGLSE